MSEGKSSHQPKAACSPLGKFSLFGRLAGESGGCTLTNGAWGQGGEGREGSMAWKWQLGLPCNQARLHIHPLIGCFPAPEISQGFSGDGSRKEVGKGCNASKSSQGSGIKLQKVQSSEAQPVYYPKHQPLRKECGQISKHIFVWCFNLILGEAGYCFCLVLIHLFLN